MSQEAHKSFHEGIRDICKRDPRYPEQSYYFVFDALDYTLKKLDKNGHVTGGELLEGIREYAVQQFGLMTQTVFKNWGITQTVDFGDIVFNLVDHNLMGKTNNDTKKDFTDVYDFEEVFNRQLDVEVDKEWETEK